MFSKLLAKYKKRYDSLDKDITKFNKMFNHKIIKGHDNNKQSYDMYTLTGLISRYFFEGNIGTFEDRLVPFLLIALIDYEEDPNEMFATEVSQNDTHTPLYYITCGFSKNPTLACHLAAILISFKADVDKELYTILDKRSNRENRYVLDYTDILDNDRDTLKTYNKVYTSSNF